MNKTSNTIPKTTHVKVRYIHSGIEIFKTCVFSSINTITAVINPLITLINILFIRLSLIMFFTKNDLSKNLLFYYSDFFRSETLENYLFLLFFILLLTILISC